MSARPRAIKTHRFRKAQTVRLLEGGKTVRKAVEGVLATYNWRDLRNIKAESNEESWCGEPCDGCPICKGAKR